MADNDEDRLSLMRSMYQNDDDFEEPEVIDNPSQALVSPAHPKLSIEYISHLENQVLRLSTRADQQDRQIRSMQSALNAHRRALHQNQKMIATMERDLKNKIDLRD